ncbi:MAG: 16S rRNA (guanine(966)-N(2))-methyltransferase RsmD [Deltaproteobacteria bacterium]|nr:16S rRNA (guanine(966)-N(2))-methyltransferase RsmD [Deltaproteobacteria bacterium]
MRIIGGEFKGRRLLVPHGRRIRPTSDRVREAIFDILGPAWTFQRALDLFAGTGSLGIEALSRGADEVVFVEQGKGALTILKGNLKALGLKSRSWVLPLTAKRGIAVLGERKEAFDLIFIDPPYGKGLGGKTIEEITRRGIINSAGVIVIEHSSKEEIILPTGLELSQQRRYGDTSVSFFHKASPSP